MINIYINNKYISYLNYRYKQNIIKVIYKDNNKNIHRILYKLVDYIFY